MGWWFKVWSKELLVCFLFCCTIVKKMMLNFFYLIVKVDVIVCVIVIVDVNFCLKLKVDDNFCESWWWFLCNWWSLMLVFVKVDDNFCIIVKVNVNFCVIVKRWLEFKGIRSERNRIWDLSCWNLVYENERENCLEFNYFYYVWFSCLKASTIMIDFHV